MSKTNFSKVEKSLEEGMIQMKAKSLLNEADALKGIPEDTSTIPSKDVCNTVLTKLEKDLKKMRKENESLYKKFYKFDLKKLINNPSALTPQDWQAVKEIKSFFRLNLCRLKYENGHA